MPHTLLTGPTFLPQRSLTIIISIEMAAILGNMDQMCPPSAKFTEHDLPNLSGKVRLFGQAAFVSSSPVLVNIRLGRRHAKSCIDRCT